MIAGVSLCFLGGPPTDLKHLANRSEWKGQTLKKTYRKTLKLFHTIQSTKHFFNAFFKEMIGIDLVWEMVKLQVCFDRLSVYVYLTLLFSFVCLLKLRVASLFTLGVIKKIVF